MSGFNFYLHFPNFISFLLCPTLSYLISASFLFHFLFHLITDFEIELYAFSVHESRLGPNIFIHLY